MTISTASPLSAVTPPPAATIDEFDLDIRIVERGPVAAALLGDTDDGCDTVRGSNC
ncbi:FxLD family lanthipeptide [Frankia sp. AgB32]|uniref:FxLD family lanthipeptide n=1 Tax=Frankia sp. AgB32 TaxID=631119 RepID=UPI00200E428B|nr:FxLD family lanthipeptide [Frankia sp. AgB32]MCK9895023.1 FxLD family lanthipeptide [Frankia sp. AgB32]